MSDQEVKGKKIARGKGRIKGSGTSSSSGTKDADKNHSQSAAGNGSKKSGIKKKGSSITTTTITKGLKVGRGRGRIRIEDSSSDEEIVPKVEPNLETNVIPVEVKQEQLMSNELEEKVSDENYINRLIKTETIIFPEVNHLIHSTPTPSLLFKNDLDDDITPPLSFVGPRMNVALHNNKPLSWNHKVNLIGDKCPSPRIHICEKCERPILLYGRLIPCKHVFCYDCAKANPVCLRCTDKVARVEKNKLGAVFMCSYDNCRRTYLSHRDLQAHVSHRHLKRSSNQLSTKQSPQIASTPSSSSTAVASPSTSIGSSSSMKLHSFSLSRSKTNTLSGSNFTQISSRATSSSIPMSTHDDTISNERKHHHHQHQHQHQPYTSAHYTNTSSKVKLPNSKNLLITGKSSNLTPQLLVNLPRNAWPTSGQPSSTISSASSSFTSPTLSSSLTTSSWNLPLITDPRQSSTINRHFYQ